jgi:hypothetical protein
VENILRQNNLSLLRDVDRLRGMLLDFQPKLPAEWLGCHKWTLEGCRVVREQVNRNLRDLDYNQPAIFPDVLSQTQAISRALQNLSRVASTVLRASPGDRVALRVLLWLHMSHAKTSAFPVAVSNEDFSIWPVKPTMYMLPCTVQHSLLYLPLFFHEFGHLLYALHHLEMDALVKELQEKIAELLVPLSQMDDIMAAQVMQEQQVVVERWFEWMQELFCDALGLTIGGASYVRAFSTYLRMRGRDQFLVPKDDLELQSHPVTWLRIKMLVARLRAGGGAALAHSLEREWDQLASIMKVKEEYFGFYTEDFLEPVQTTLKDMLTEANPVGLESPVAQAPAVGGFCNPVPALVEAWDRFLASPDTYDAWEGQTVGKLLAAAPNNTTVLVGA